MKDKNIYKKLIYILLFFVSLSIILYVFKSDPANGPILPCLFNVITGYKCPGCGMTRAVNSIMHGEIIGAYSYNKLILLIPIGSIIYFIFKLLDKNTERLVWIYIFIVILYAILRNI